jgi:hypothetical protein
MRSLEEVLESIVFVQKRMEKISEKEPRSFYFNNTWKKYQNVLKTLIKERDRIKSGFDTNPSKEILDYVKQDTNFIERMLQEIATINTELKSYKQNMKDEYKNKKICCRESEQNINRLTKIINTLNSL